MNADEASGSQELLPCPFCGEPAEHDSQRWQPRMRAEMQERFVTGHAVTCSKCEAEVGVFDAAEEAIAAWNRRAPVEGVTPQTPTEGASNG